MRQSVLFAHCMILCSVDGQFLLEDHPREMADCHSWLAGEFPIAYTCQGFSASVPGFCILGQLYSPVLKNAAVRDK